MAFAQDPSMGVACHVPNWIGCDRVGLAVWLRRPAIAVSATIPARPSNSTIRLGAALRATGDGPCLWGSSSRLGSSRGSA